MNGGVIACLVCLCIVGEVTAPAGPGSSVFVSPSGDDTKGDGTFSHPYRTIQRGVDTVADEGRVHVLPGRYSVSSGSHSSCSVVSIEGKSVTLEGSGCDETVLDGCGQCRAVHIHPGEIHVDILSVSIVNGSSVLDGGAVLVEGGGTSHVTFANTTFSHNTAMGSGGAIFLNAAKSVSMENVFMEDNHAGNAGGALVSSGTSLLSMINSHLQDNTAGVVGGAVCLVSASSASLDGCTFLRNQAVAGGALFMADVEDVALRTSTFYQDRVQFTDQFHSLSIPGLDRDLVVGNEGGAIFCDGGSISLIDTSFTSHVAWRGGAVRIVARATDIKTSIFTANAAMGLPRTGDGMAGAVYASGNTFHISDSVFRANVGQGSGGALLLYDQDRVDVHTVRLEGNSAIFFGGGFFLQRIGYATLYGVIFHKNNATSPGVGGGAGLAMDNVLQYTMEQCQWYGNSGPAGGGAYLFESGGEISDATFQANFALKAGSGLEVKGGRVTLSRSVFRSNGMGPSLQCNIGGAVYFLGAEASLFNSSIEGNAASVEGAGLAAVGAPFLSIHDVIFRSNKAGWLGGGISISDSHAVRLGNLTFSDCSSFLGGALSLVKTVDILVEDVNILSCVAQLQGGAMFVVDSTLEARRAVMVTCVSNGIGGGIHCSNSSITLWDCSLLQTQCVMYGCGLSLTRGSNGTVLSSTITNCGSPSAGGGIRADGSTSLLLEDSFISGNHASAGGGLFLDGQGTVIARRTHFLQNSAHPDGFGGGVLLYQGTFHCISCTFDENRGKLGGALRLTGGSIAVVEASSFTGNSVTEGGGAAMLTASCTLHMSNCQIHDNLCHGGGGGGVYLLHEGRIVIESSQFERNTATEDGGALLFLGDGQISSTHFDGNEAGKNGGAVSLQGSDAVVILTNCEAHGNRAPNGGGGAYYHDTPSNPISLKDSHGTNNTAAYGAFIATQASEVPVRVQMNHPPPSHARSGYEFSTTLSTSLLDLYDQIVMTDNVSRFYLEVEGDGSTLGDTAPVSREGTASFVHAGVQGVLGSHMVCVVRTSNPTVEHVSFGVDLETCRPGEYPTLGDEVCILCPEGTYGVDGDSCHECPAHATCPGGQEVVVNKGYWREPGVVPPKIHSCPGSGCGVNGTCRAHHFGRLCAACEEDYSKVYGQCVSCTGLNAWLLVLFILSVVGFVSYLMLRSLSGIGVLRSFMFFIQILAVIRTPSGPSTPIVSISNFDPDVFELCVAPMSYFDRFYVVFIMIPALCGVALLVAVSYHCYQSLRSVWHASRVAAPMVDLTSPQDKTKAEDGTEGAEETEGTEETEDAEDAEDAKNTWTPVSEGVDTPSLTALQRLSRTLLQILSFSYNPVATASFEMFVCIHVTGVSVLKADPAVECSGDAYHRARAVAWLGTAFVVGLPVFFSALIFGYVRTRRQAPATLAFLGPLFFGFREDLYFWEIIILMRRVAVVAIVQLTEGSLKEIFTVSIMSLLLLIHIHAKPFRLSVENRFEWATLASLLLVAWLQTSTFCKEHEILLTIVVILVLTVNTAVAVALLARRTILHFLNWLRGVKGRRISLSFTSAYPPH